MKRLGLILAVTAWLLLFTEGSAYAYIDPAAGSLFLQLLLGGIAGLGVLIKMYWRRITGLFARTDDSDASS